MKETQKQNDTKQKDEIVTQKVWRKMPAKRIQRVPELIPMRKVE